VGEDLPHQGLHTAVTPGRFLAGVRALTPLDGGVSVPRALAVSAMILPGVSGSLILVVPSQYIRVTEALKGFLDGLVGLATGDPGAEFATRAGEVVVLALDWYAVDLDLDGV
jgi:hypothetical protein